MTEVGAGGIEFSGWEPSRRFKRMYGKLDPTLQRRVDSALEDLLRSPRLPGLGLEKYQGYNDPAIYTIRVNAGHRISLEVRDGNVAWLRKVGNHDEITRSP